MTTDNACVNQVTQPSPPDPSTDPVGHVRWMYYRGRMNSLAANQHVALVLDASLTEAETLTGIRIYG